MSDLVVKKPYVVRFARFCSGLVIAFCALGLLGTALGFFILASSPETYGDRWNALGGLVLLVPGLVGSIWLFGIQKTRKRIAWYATIPACLLYFGVPAMYILCNWFKPEVRKWYNVDVGGIAPSSAGVE